MKQFSIRSLFSVFTISLGLLGGLGIFGCARVGMCDDTLSAIEAMKKVTAFMTSRVAVHGGYVYDASLDLKKRRGEGIATPSEIWVQPPGTPTVGLAFVRAFDATGEQVFLTAATECANPLRLQIEIECAEA